MFFIKSLVIFLFATAGFGQHARPDPVAAMLKNLEAIEAESALFISDGIPENLTEVRLGARARKINSNLRIVATNLLHFGQATFTPLLPSWFRSTLKPSYVLGASEYRRARLVDERYVLCHLDNQNIAGLDLFQERSFDVIAAKNTLCFCLDKHQSCGGFQKQELVFSNLLRKYMSLLSSKEGAFVWIYPIVIPQKHSHSNQKELFSVWKRALDKNSSRFEYEWVFGESESVGLVLTKKR